MNTLQKIFFYLSSFIPLYILLVIQNLKIRNIKGELLTKETFINQFLYTSTSVTFFWLGLLILFILSICGTALFFLGYSKNSGRPAKITGSEFIREDTMGYIVTYIVPLLSMNINSPRSLIINVLLFIIIGTFYVKNDQVFMNPLYNLFGYNVFSSDKDIYITKIRKSKLRTIAKNKYQVYKVNVVGDIYILKENEQEQKNPHDLY